MYCNNCGKQLEDGVKYCNGCGHKIEINTIPVVTPIISEESQNINPHPLQGQHIGTTPIQNEVKKESPVKPKNKRLVWIILGVVLALTLLYCLSRCAPSADTSSDKIAEENAELKNRINKMTESITNLNSEKEALEETIQSQNSQINDLQKKVDDLSSQIEEYENGAAALLIDIKNAYEHEDWQTVVDKANTLHNKFNGGQEDQEAQPLAAEAQQKLAEEAEKAAAEEAAGYETGITYDQLARTPDDYTGKNVKFSGKVVKVIEGDNETHIRLAVDRDYDTIIYAAYESDLVSSRVLEDDNITIYGISIGNYTYESTLGGQITIPAVWVEKIDQ